MSELKPCPFCGGEGTYEELSQMADGTVIPASVRCDNCDIGFYAKPDWIIYGWATEKDIKAAEEKVCHMWNRRWRG